MLFCVLWWIGVSVFIRKGRWNCVGRNRALDKVANIYWKKNKAMAKTIYVPLFQNEKKANYFNLTKIKLIFLEARIYFVLPSHSQFPFSNKSIALVPAQAILILETNIITNQTGLFLWSFRSLFVGFLLPVKQFMLLLTADFKKLRPCLRKPRSPLNFPFLPMNLSDLKIHSLNPKVMCSAASFLCLQANDFLRRLLGFLRIQFSQKYENLILKSVDKAPEMETIEENGNKKNYPSNFKTYFHYSFPEL